MSTSFNWLYLGKTLDIDPREGSYSSAAGQTAEHAKYLVGKTFGSAENPLYNEIEHATMVDRGGERGYLDNGNHSIGGRFGYGQSYGRKQDDQIVSDGDRQDIDASAAYYVTLSYADGSHSKPVAMALVQGEDGSLYLAPPPNERTSTGTSNTSLDVLTNKPIVSLKINKLISDRAVLAADRQQVAWKDGVVDGTDGDDRIDYSYVEPVAHGSDRIDHHDGVSGAGNGYNDDVVRAGAGNDIVHSGLGDDTVYGDAGDDYIDGGAGDDVLYGGSGNDTLVGGAGNNTLYGGAGNDTFVLGEGHNVIVDFGGDNSGNLDDKDHADNDFVDLSAYYNDETLAKWNADHPDQTYKNPLEWLHADASDGVLDNANGLQILANDRTAVDAGKLNYNSTGVTCFTLGTRIRTPDGDVAIEELHVGDMVVTADHGEQPIRWIGRRHLNALELKQTPKLRPIRIRAGAMGLNMPQADLVVSPQHRVLVRSRIVARVTGHEEVLVGAKHLLDVDGIDIDTAMMDVEYFHILFDDHEVVFAHGVPTESLYTGIEALKMVSPEAREELFALFPELRDQVLPASARPLVKGKVGRTLAQRHQKNRVSLVA